MTFLVAKGLATQPGMHMLIAEGIPGGQGLGISTGDACVRSDGKPAGKGKWPL